uniref:Growth hormone releasing hormone receptor a n=1 Tax=Astatotilapia calliptera TaxID=8154 RepID=A0AAX7VGG6_ASTCA
EISGCSSPCFNNIHIFVRLKHLKLTVSLRSLFGFPTLGYVYRNCTADGWSEMYPPYEEACAFSDDSEPESETSYLYTFRQVYTVGYATSLISLITAIVVFAFRCTRNYIHINLFASFILRASAVFIKDTVLFADETLDHFCQCPPVPL